MPPSPWMKKRLRKELERFVDCSHHGFQLLSPNPSKYTDSELQEWNVVMSGMSLFDYKCIYFDDLYAIKSNSFNVCITLLKGPKNSVYHGETYHIKAKFGDNYPMEPPAIVFTVDTNYKPPEHKHVYSNGLICMSLLATDYSPALTLESLLVAIQSMLASATKKEKPRDDGLFVRMYGYNPDPRKLKWDFHDEEC